MKRETWLDVDPPRAATAGSKIRPTWSHGHGTMKIRAKGGRIEHGHGEAPYYWTGQAARQTVAGKPRLVKKGR